MDGILQSSPLISITKCPGETYKDITRFDGDAGVSHIVEHLRAFGWHSTYLLPLAISDPEASHDLAMGVCMAPEGKRMNVHGLIVGTSRLHVGGGVRWDGATSAQQVHSCTFGLSKQ